MVPSGGPSTDSTLITYPVDYVYEKTQARFTSDGRNYGKKCTMLYTAGLLYFYDKHFSFY